MTTASPEMTQVTEACDDDSLMIPDTARRRWRQLPLRWHRSQRHATTTAEEQELSETTRLEQRSSIFHLCQKESTTEITTLYNILKFKGHFAVNCYQSIFWSLRQMFVVHEQYLTNSNSVSNVAGFNHFPAENSNRPTFKLQPKQLQMQAI